MSEWVLKENILIDNAESFLWLGSIRMKFGPRISSLLIAPLLQTTIFIYVSKSSGIPRRSHLNFSKWFAFPSAKFGTYRSLQLDQYGCFQNFITVCLRIIQIVNQFCSSMWCKERTNIANLQFYWHSISGYLFSFFGRSSRTNDLCNMWRRTSCWWL